MDIMLLVVERFLHHHSPELWTQFEHRADYGPVVYKGERKKGKRGVAHPDVPEPFSSIVKLMDHLDH